MNSLTSLRSPALAVCALLSFASCRVQKPATEVPPPPSISAFTSSSERVAAGGKVVLSWTTENATSVELREANAGTLPVATDTVNGSFEAMIDRASLYVLIAKGPGGSDTRALSVALEDAGVGAISFSAIPPEINAGASTTLVWTALGASRVSITANGQALELAGQGSTGAVVVSPSFDTTYTLDADGSTRTTTVTVSPVLFAAEVSPRAAQVGQTITVSWEAAGADRVSVSSPGRGMICDTMVAAQILEGQCTDTVPPTPVNGVVAYDVTVHKGTQQVTRRLEVNVGVAATITRFEAPSVAAASASYAVRWQTAGADAVEVRIDGVLVYRTSTLAQAVNGLHAFAAPAQDFAVELTATNVSGGRASQLAQVDAVGVPSAVTLTANPTSVQVGSPVTLTYACPEGRRVRIVNTAGEVVFSTTGQTAESGTAVVYPTADTTYTITADNQLGNPPVTATAAVTVTGTPLAVTQTPTTAISGQLVSINTASQNALFYGFPHSQVLEAGQAAFIDISTTGQRVLEAPTEIATLTVPFSVILWGTRQTGPITISRAGWLAWGAPLTVLSSNPTSLPSTSGPPALLAPFWDDLTLVANTSGVFAQLVGDAPDERLIVQWNRMRVGTNASTEVTFQVQIHQRGPVSFQYATMNLPSSPDFVIGHQGPARRYASSSRVVPPSNSARYFFSPIAAPFDLRLTKGQTYGGLVKTGDMFTPVTATANAVDVPGDLLITELMFRPSIATGQYFEVLNRTNAPVDLSGWLVSAANTPSFVVPQNFSLAPGVPTVIAASLDPALNDDAGARLEWGSSGFAFSWDAGTVTFGTTDAGVSLPYAGLPDGGYGTATHYEPGPLVYASSTAQVYPCFATTPFGNQTPQQLGSPGALSYCFGYVIESIPAHFVDVSDGGTRLVNSPTSAVDGQTTSIRLATDAGTDPAPIVFGVRRPVVSMSVDGWLALGSTSTVDFSNTSTPGVAPNGKMAIFWDDLHTTPNRTPVSDLYWKRIAAAEDPLTPAPHWVFQWSHVRHYNTSPADDLNFEIKLFEDGVIEYHYGTMTSGTTSNYADGNSASIWLEQEDGKAARAISINQPGIQPNTAYRFVPR